MPQYDNYLELLKEKEKEDEEFYNIKAKEAVNKIQQEIDILKNKKKEEINSLKNNIELLKNESKQLDKHNIEATQMLNKAKNNIEGTEIIVSKNNLELVKLRHSLDNNTEVILRLKYEKQEFSDINKDLEQQLLTISEKFKKNKLKNKYLFILFVIILFVSTVLFLIFKNY